MNDRQLTGEGIARILIAEDSPTQAQQLRYILEREGYAVDVASNGHMALQMARDMPPALIISDVIMPEMDGYDLSSAVKADPTLNDIPIILVTTMSDPQDVIRGLECGADNFVLKPYEERYLLGRVRYVILNRQMRRANDVGIGVEIYFNGERHFITADRLQILNLLLSTYEAAIQRNKELNRSQEELQGTNSRLNDLKLELERRVQERTEELERSNKALRDSEARLRLTIDTALDAVITMDSNGIIRDWNTQAEAIFGWSRSEALGRTLHDMIIPPDLRDEHLRGFQNYLANEEGPLLNRRIEVVGLRRDGSSFPVELSIAPIMLQGTLMFSGFLRDITERIASEQKIRDLSRVNAMILTNAAEGIIAVERGGRLVFANPAARRLLGWKPEETVSDVHAALHHGETGDSCAFFKATRGEVFHPTETTFNTPDQRIEILFTSAPILEEGGITGAVLTFVDVRERKRLERQLEQANRISGLGRVAATIAHEFNNVLMGIQPFTEIIRRRSDDEKIMKAAAQISTSVTRGKRVTEEILRFTQPAEPALRPINIGQWLLSLLPELRALASQRIQVLTDIPEEPLKVGADPIQLQQVITNLVMNGRDAIPGNGFIRITVRHQGATNSPDALVVPGGFVLLTVADSGSGMSEHVLKHIFDPLFTTKRTGTGLGLAVTEQVIRSHGGSIHAESQPGNGTTFFIRLPVTIEESVAPSEAADSISTPVKRVVLVEDDIAVATGITLLLEAENIEVRVANSGGEALPLIKIFHPDVVVLDLSLPDMNGVEVYDWIASEFPDLPVLFSSGNGDQSSLEHYFVSGRVALLRKPYDYAALSEAIRRITDS